MSTSALFSKKSLLALLLVTSLGIAQAQPRFGPRPWGGGWRYDPWVAPLIVGATVGTAVYLSRPYAPMTSTVVVTQPPAVVVNTLPSSYGYATTTIGAPVPVAEAYYCRESAQYYPAVQTCPSTWMLVRNVP